MSTSFSARLKNTPVIIRIHAITLVALLGIVALALVSAMQLRDKLEGEAEARTQQIEEIAQSIAKHYHEETEAGRLTKAQAQAEASAALRAMRYDNGNYIFAMNSEATVLVNGGSPTLERPLAAQAPDLAKSVAEIADFANKHGAGFIRYEINKPGETELKHKVAYVATFKPWGWIIGTGIYLDNIGTRVNAAFLQTAAVGAIAILLVALVGWVLANGIVRPLGRVVAAQERLIANDLDFDMRDIDRADEIGRLARGVLAAKDFALERKKLAAEVETRRMTAQEEMQHKAEHDRKYIAEFEQFMGSLTTALERLSGGDLTFRLNTAFASEYEKIRADFNTSVEKLQQTMLNVSANAAAIRSGTNDITLAADDLAHRTEQQAASLEETAAALDEITATVRKTAEGASHAREVVTTAKGDAERGGTVVGQAVEAMSGIEKSSQQIGQIIGVIDEIAFQTNLLALNAGVEAARAGDAGRGFAVVASEVRALAQRSAEAAKEIKALIMASRGQVEQGVNLVAETGKALKRIFTQVAEIDKVVSEIALSAQEEATGLHEVNTAINQMDQVTQQNAAMVEESTAASHALAQKTEDLAQLIGRFQVGQANNAVQDDPQRRAAGKLASLAPARMAAAPAKAPAARPAMKTVGPRGGAAAKPSADDWAEF